MRRINMLSPKTHCNSVECVGPLVGCVSLFIKREKPVPNLS